MKLQEELIKIICKLEEIKIDFEDVKVLKHQVDKLEKDQAFAMGAIKVILFFIPIIIGLIIKGEV